MIMRIKTLLIEQDGHIVDRYRFDEQVNTIPIDRASTVGEILQLLVRVPFRASPLPYNVRFFAAVEMPAIVFVCGKKNKGSTRWHFSVKRADRDEDATADYDRALYTRFEDDITCFAHSCAREYPFRLFRYRDMAQYDETHAFAARTKGYSTTDSFRRFVKEYIRSFSPILLRQGKPFKLQLSQKGVFTVQNEQGDECRCLSESEQTMMRYLCFLYLTDFWSKACSLRDLHYIDKPLLIADLLEFLDDSIDPNSVLDHARFTNRQVFVFAPHPITKCA